MMLCYTYYYMISLGSLDFKSSVYSPVQLSYQQLKYMALELDPAEYMRFYGSSGLV